jgi:CubicO group peptidase (beta-lactamase class C family)
MAVTHPEFAVRFVTGTRADKPEQVPAARVCRRRRVPSAWCLRGLLALTVMTLVVTLGGVPAAAAPAAGGLPHGHLQAILGDLVRDTGVPGAIGLARDDSRVWRGATGLAILNPAKPMRARDRFKVGSVTKTFIATVVLQLVGEGRLRLSDSVERWLPGLIPGGENVTIRHLLSHTSGLYNYTEDPRLVESYADDLHFVWHPWSSSSWSPTTRGCSRPAPASRTPIRAFCWPD